jgi:hypothetical protein
MRCMRIWLTLHHKVVKVVLGDNAFIKRSQQDRNEVMAQVYLSGIYTMPEIGTHFGVHYL